MTEGLATPSTRDRAEREFPEGAAIVAGGSGGLGQAVCDLLARRGSDVALTYHHNREAGETGAAMVRAQGREAELRQVQLQDSPAVGLFLSDMVERFGGVHSVVYAAGPDIRQRYVSEVTPKEWRESVDADLNGFFNLVHAALPCLRARRGALVAITTMAHVRYPPRDILSAAPKAAVEQLVQGIAREEGRYGVRANCVAPGMIEAGLGQRIIDNEFTPEVAAAVRRNAALRRFGRIEEVAEAVVFLASARASYVTGTTLVVDGGASI